MSRKLLTLGVLTKLVALTTAPKEVPLANLLMFPRHFAVRLQTVFGCHFSYHPGGQDERDEFFVMTLYFILAPGVFPFCRLLTDY